MEFDIQGSITGKCSECECNKTVYMVVVETEHTGFREWLCLPCIKFIYGDVK